MPPEQLPTPNTLNKLVKDDMPVLSAMLSEHYVLSDDPFIDETFETDSLRGRMMTQIVEAVAVFSGMRSEEHRQVAHRAAHFAVTVARLEAWRIDEELYTSRYLKNIILELESAGLEAIAMRIAEDTEAYMSENPELELLAASYAPCLATTEREEGICQSVIQTMFMLIDIDMTRRATEQRLGDQLAADLEAWDGILNEDVT